jgi:thioredoxin reductase (NADPH)
MTDIKHHKLIIIGSGPAGYTAAVYAARANLQPMLISGNQPGGQLSITTDVENYPGFADVIQGPWLMEQMQQQAKNVGTLMLEDHVTELNLKTKPFAVKTESGKSFTADSVIISTGAQAKWMGLPSEEKFRGFGVSGCATCDGFFFRKKKVMVIGGGNTAVEEALYLTNHASEVTLVHRRDSLRAEKMLQERLLKHPKIKVLWNHVLEEVLGDDNPLNVTGAKLKDTITDGIFIAIGHKPNTGIVKGQLDLDEEGYIITKPGSVTTNIPGVFACGDVQDKIYKQAVTAAGTGCMSALEAEKFLSS